MLRTPPIRRAPRLLFRRPAVLATVIGATAVLGMVAALTPLFLSSASSAALQQELAGRCAASFGGQTSNYDHPDVVRRELTDATAGDPAFLAPRLYLEGALLTGSNANGEGLTIPIRFSARDEFRDHIELLEGEHGPGPYINDVTARDLGAGPDDTIVFNLRGDTFEVTVQAVYRGLYDRTSDPYWCFQEDVLALTIMGDLPPPLVLVDTDYFEVDSELYRGVFARTSGGLGVWEMPIAVDGLTVPGAERAAATLASAEEDIHNRQDFGGSGIQSDLPIVTTRVSALASALRTSIIPLAAIVLLAAVGLVAAAGSYWVDRRKMELQYLSALGVGPGTVAFKAVLEFLVPALLGSALGWGIANVAIAGLGPSPDVDGEFRLISAWAVAGSAAVSLLSVAAIVGARARTLLDHKPRSRRTLAWRIPLLLLSAAGAVLVRIAIGDSAVVTEENDLVGSVDPLVLFLPLLTFTAAVLLVAEVVIRLFPLIRKLGARGHAAYLASRRIVSAPGLVIVLIAGAALPVATLLYAGSLTRSATSTIDAKGKTFIGADVSTPVFEIIDPPGTLEDTSTVVIKTERVSFNGTQVDVLAIDYDTFAKGAFWEEEFAEVPLSTILDDLRGDTGSAPLDAYLSNSADSAEIDSGELSIRGESVAVNVVGELETFPGTRRNRPLLVVDRDRYVNTLADDQGRLPGSRYLMWTLDHTEDEVELEMKTASVGFAFTTAASTTLDQLRFASLIWTFDFLEIYSYLAGLIAIGAILLYVDTRQRARNLSYALARRMGLTRREHMVAGFFEIGSLTLLGIMTGLIAGRIPARQLYSILDAVPESPPSPRWIGATDLALITLAIGVLVAIIATVLAQRTADGADTSELLRHGE